jgi:methylase of polypeptide subunit release factors
MSQAPDLSPADQALLSLLQTLEAQGYDFTPPTNLTYERVRSRPDRKLAKDLRDVLGWSLPFRREHIPAQFIELLEAAGALSRTNGLCRSTLRVSRVRGLLFLHSAYPTASKDAVFLGPDSYRFAEFVAGELTGRSWVGRLVDVGAGAGVGALTAAAGRGKAQLVLTDANPKALRLAKINALHAGLPVELRRTTKITDIPDAVDLVLANPPFMMDPDGRTYRDGGDMHGARLSFDWAVGAYAKLSPGGRVLLYTGSAIPNGGRDELKAALSDFARQNGARLSYRELDPDIFGEELETESYKDVERIAAVGAVITKPRTARAQS